MEKIEFSNQSGKFTLAEIQQKVRESRQFWTSPAGRAQQAKLDRESRARAANPAGTRFPTLKNTKANVSQLRKNLLDRKF